MSKTEILYKDIAPAAEDDASVATSGAASFSNLAQLPHGVESVAVASCERNCWGLNGQSRLVTGQNLAFWSTEQSGEDCRFTNAPVITVTFSEQHSSLGVTLAFDQTGTYCTQFNIKWYQGSTLKADVDYTPTGPTAFCQQTVTSYDKVVITLNGTDLPYRYAKLEHIIFGVYRYFGMSELRNASITNQMNCIASELPISKMKWTLDSREDVDFMFQLKQPVQVHNNGGLIGVYYIDSYSRSTKNVYAIDCYDAFGVLDESPFQGGVYTSKSAKALLNEIVGGDFMVDCEAADVNLTGVIQSCTRREAAQQVLFPWGACASTDGRESIRVFALGAGLSAIGEDRTYSGVTVDTSAIVTEVRVTAHTYTQSSDGSVEIGGVKYKDIETVYTVKNPSVTANDRQNVIEVSGATLVSTAIGQATAQRVYDYYQKRNTNKGKFVWAGERLGDYVSLPNAWGGTNAGHIEKLEIALSNTVAASSETVGV